MRALVQRVTEARVDVQDVTVGQIGPGLLILFCAMAGDSVDDVAKFAEKISKLRILRDGKGRMNRSLSEMGGSVLIVSQFTLAADTSRGHRPGFSQAAPAEPGQRIYNAFCSAMADLNIPVERGKFGADMQVYLVNDGPVTIWLDTQT
ncbi:MAG: D-aminoacyl-tRNA deacylase [Pseudomonadota bacterium]